jgi:hypothetical protein
MLFTPQGLHTMDQTFIGGAVLGVIGLFTKSPLTHCCRSSYRKLKKIIPLPQPCLGARIGYGRYSERFAACRAP